MSGCVVITDAVIAQTLATAPTPGKNFLEPLLALAKTHNLPIKILEDVAVVNKAEVHLQEGDLWQCLSGKVQFTYGGALIDPYIKQNADGSLNMNEQRGTGIQGGTIVTLQPGDWLWIPAGQPHQHSCVGVARLVIIKIPAK